LSHGESSRGHVPGNRSAEVAHCSIAHARAIPHFSCVKGWRGEAGVARMARAEGGVKLEDLKLEAGVWLRFVEKMMAREAKNGDLALLGAFWRWRGGFVFGIRLLCVVCCSW